MTQLVGERTVPKLQRINITCCHLTVQHPPLATHHDMARLVRAAQ